MWFSIKLMTVCNINKDRWRYKFISWLKNISHKKSVQFTQETFSYDYVKASKPKFWDDLNYFLFVSNKNMLFFNPHQITMLKISLLH